MTGRVGTVLLVVLVVAAFPAGTVSAVSTSSGEDLVRASSEEPLAGERLSSTGENTLLRTTTFALRPSEPGVIRAEVAFSVPDQVVELTTAVPANTTVVDQDGFQAAGDGNYTWDEATDQPSLTLSIAVNRTGNYHQRPDGSTGEPGYTFADTGEWAIATVPSASVWWSSVQSEPRVTFAGETAVAGEGVAGDRMVYLGEHDSRTRTIDGQELTLVVPAAATLEPSSDAIFRSLETAANGLPASPVQESVLIAAPTTVDWGPNGLADGSDTWVRADEPVDVPGNVWVHEFVHLRQDFRTTPATRWIREGMPEYYAALFTLEAGQIDFDEFAAHLDRGTRSRYADVVLAEPDTWTGLSNYAKGALVFGDLDRRIRASSDGGAGALQVYEAMNEHEGPVDQAFLDEQITAVSDSQTAGAFEEATATTATPTMWSVDDHREAFGTAPPKLTTAVEEPLRVSGPYRNRSVSSLPTLVPGERVRIPVTVRNEGDASGEFEVQLEADGTAVDAANGTLAGGAETTVDFFHTVSRTGQVELVVGTDAWTVSVAEPAPPVVAELSAQRETVPVGETVNVTARFENPATVPANGTVGLAVDGIEAENWPVKLDVGESSNRTAEVEISSPGDNRIELGNRSVLVNGVSSDGDTDRTSRGVTTSGTTSTRTPGLTPSTAFVAFLVAAWLVLPRRQ
ncbi:MAG: CARDB domain-containing protein [Halodesulfurarchaeum sp.]